MLTFTKLDGVFAMLQMKMSEGGRDVVPDEIRQSPGLKEGDAVLFEKRNGEVFITTKQARLERARAMFRKHVPAGGPSIADEPIAEDGAFAGQLRAATRRHGLSPGDRLCLAAAHRLGCPALTADRPWPDLATPPGLDIRCIRPASQ